MYTHTHMVNPKQRSHNPHIGKVITHKDKRAWLRQLELRHRMTMTPSLSFCRIDGYFDMYETWPVVAAGWKPTWSMVVDHASNKPFDIDELIAIFDKRFGFIDITMDTDDKPPVYENTDWFVEDESYTRDLRSNHRDKKRRCKIA